MLSSETWAEPDCHTRIFKEVVQRYLPKPFSRRYAQVGRTSGWGRFLSTSDSDLAKRVESKPCLAKHRA